MLFAVLQPPAVTVEIAAYARMLIASINMRMTETTSRTHQAFYFGVTARKDTSTELEEMEKRCQMMDA